MNGQVKAIESRDIYAGVRVGDSFKAEDHLMGNLFSPA
jgi:hypothetical protein